MERPFLHCRDLRSGKFVGRQVAAIIRSPRRTAAFVGGLILVVLVGAQWYWRPAEEARLQCAERGAVDSPQEVDARADLVDIVGWMHDYQSRDRVRRIVVSLGERVVGATVPAYPRPDVAAALPLCRVGKPGFRVQIRRKDLPATDTTLIVEAERTSGQRYRIGTVDLRFGPPLVSLDRVEPPTLGGENLIAGWAWHPSGPVKVSWTFGEKVLATAIADQSREDIAAAFPGWPQTAMSGFGFRVKSSDLPRGAGKTTLEFIAPDGQHREIDGPYLQNEDPIGKVIVDDNQQELINPRQLPVRAWLFDEHGIATATVETELGIVLGAMRRVSHGVPLPGLFTDPRGIPPGDFWGAALRQGTLFEATVATGRLPSGIHRVVVRVRNTVGREVVLPGHLVAVGLPALPARCAGEPFGVYLWATTGMLRSGMPELGALSRLAESGCVRIGLHVRVEYLRTTRGRAGDFEFDPDFPEALRAQPGREMTTTSLREALAMADRYRVPMRILLDGGVWADSHFSIPEYDITDWLEEDDRNVQWNQFGKTEPDDALRGLPGGHDNPQLGRVITLNLYNQSYRHYKKRNLQAAIRLIVEYNSAHPDRPVSVTFDPDLYINPWFYLKEWYDYNPDTLRQFREWLTHSGPYSDGGQLAGQGYRERLDLARINAVAQASWHRIEEVDPPRGKPDYASPWHQIWTLFKRHLVARHYADLAHWAHEAGMDSKLIFSAQTFIQSDVSVTGTDTATGWVDEAGVSIAGAKPPDGRLGAILYGPASRNAGKSRNDRTLLANIRAADPQWAVSEMNPANIERPDALPNHRETYQTISSIFNFGAGGISPMWNGRAGDLSVRPGQFKSYETFGQSPFETQLVLFLREIANVPRGGQLWTFGNEYLASADGFEALTDSELGPMRGHLRLGAKGGQGCGMVRDLEGWPVPAAAELVVQGGRLSDAKVTATFEDGTEASIKMSRSDRSTLNFDLGPVAGRYLKHLQFRFDTCPVVLDSVVLRSTK